jgi:hypothetical protein
MAVRDEEHKDSVRNIGITCNRWGKKVIFYRYCTVRQ